MDFYRHWALDKIVTQGHLGTIFRDIERACVLLLRLHPDLITHWPIGPLVTILSSDWVIHPSL